MQRTFLVLAAASMASLVTPLAAQLPPACYCTQYSDNYQASNPDIGSASTNAYCQIVYGDGGAAACQVVGTITFTYTPSASFTWTSGQWGDPATSFSQPTPSPTPITFPHPPNATTPCGVGTVGSSLNVLGSLNGGQGPTWLTIGRRWYCTQS